MSEEKPNRPEQQFFEDPAIDRMMGVLMTLATEHWVLRDRVRALESQLAKAGQLDVAALEAAPTDEELAGAQAERDAFARALLQPLLGEQDAAGATGRFSLKGREPSNG
jgi:hypothetical protein